MSAFNEATLEHIYVTSQMAGVGLEDGDSAARIIVGNATDPIEKRVALRQAQILALNRGRPAEATQYLRLVDERRSSAYTFRQFAIAAALFSDGDRAIGDSSARALEASLAHDTIGVFQTDSVRSISAAMLALELWSLNKGDTASAARAASWLQRNTKGQPRNRVFSVLPAMILSSRGREPAGARMRAFVDSVSLAGCCALPEFFNYLLAAAYEASGDDATALQVIRRGIWYSPPRNLSQYLLEEGRLATKLGDRAGAIKAYDHYLALMSNPEPVLRPRRDSIRAEVTRLRQTH
jgi:hypothetical protein